MTNKLSRNVKTIKNDTVIERTERRKMQFAQAPAKLVHDNTEADEFLSK